FTLQEGPGRAHVQEDLRPSPGGVLDRQHQRVGRPAATSGQRGYRSNTAADLITVLHEAITQVSKQWRRRLLITCDGAGASHDLIDWAHRQNHAADCTVEYSTGFAVDADVRAAIGRLSTNR